MNKRGDMRGMVRKPKTLLGSENGNWKGGVHTRKDGYELVRIGIIPSSAKGARYKLKHRIVMEEKLGRKLLRSEVVHHINGIKSDNRPENLELTIQSEHARSHYYEREINKNGQFV